MCCTNKTIIALEYPSFRTGTVNKAGDTPLSLACANGHLDTVEYLVNKLHCDPRSKLYGTLIAATLSTPVHVQSQSTRLVTPHSLWRTKVDTSRQSNILLKNISVTQNVCVLQTYFLVSTIRLYPQLQWMRLETLLSPLSVPVVTWI